MDGGLQEEKAVTARRRTKLIHEGDYAAEVEVEIIETEEPWSPYLSLETAYKLDEVREALHVGDLKRARRLARVFRLMPLDV